MMRKDRESEPPSGTRLALDLDEDARRSRTSGSHRAAASSGDPARLVTRRHRALVCGASTTLVGLEATAHRLPSGRRLGHGHVAVRGLLRPAEDAGARVARTRTPAATRRVGEPVDDRPVELALVDPRPAPVAGLGELALHLADRHPLEVLGVVEPQLRPTHLFPVVEGRDERPEDRPPDVVQVPQAERLLSLHRGHRAPLLELPQEAPRHARQSGDELLYPLCFFRHRHSFGPISGPNRAAPPITANLNNKSVQDTFYTLLSLKFTDNHSYIKRAFS